ncbi:MAG: universal stress protein [Sediminibacterium sp.]|nr:universal stress protein [Sediminibacterium sp.]
MIHFKSRKILIPTDFSDTSLLAIRHGAFLAQYTKGDVYLLHVINAHYLAQNVFLPIVRLVDTTEYEKKVEVRLSEMAQDITKEYGVKVTPVIKTGNPINEVNSVAREIGADLVVLGTHGYTPLEELVIGGTAMKVITRSPCPTMAMSSEATKLGYNKIILPIDNSAHTRQKVNYTLELAKEFSAHVYALGLLDKDEENRLGAMEVIMHQIETLAKEKQVLFSKEIQTNVKNRATATVKYAESVGADLIVIMTDQDAELSGFFLGPYAQQVIHLSKVPTIAIKPEEHPENISFSLLSGTSGGF